MIERGGSAFRSWTLDIRFVLVLLLVFVLDAFDPLFEFEDECDDAHDLKKTA